MKIKIKIGNVELNAELNDSETAKKIYEKLPIKGKVQRWGNEIYFEIPLHVDLDEEIANEVVELGDLGFWPEGDCFCIFFGKTPASEENEIRAASKVNVFGKVVKGATLLKASKDGANILIDKV
tara:strand:+ start:61 stop:432 length:372 start_codon:yes stop_codon:yes gene_type:complete